jgi:hypothetical protein
MSRALKPGGRVVFEFGGHGNVRILVDAAYRALRQLGVQHPERLNPWYYPSIAEYSAILESTGIEVTYALLFDRPTPLQDGERGLENWWRMFGSRLMEPLDDAGRADFFRLTAEYAAPQLTGRPTTAGCESPGVKCCEPKHSLERNILRCAMRFAMRSAACFAIAFTP